MEQPPTTPPTGPATGPAGVIAAANTGLGQLDDQLWAARSPEEVEARGTAENDLAWGSSGDWYTHTAGPHRSTGHSTVRQAPILVHERTATHQALTTEDVSPEQAAVIVDAIDKLPHDQHPDTAPNRPGSDPGPDVSEGEHLVPRTGASCRRRSARPPSVVR